MFFLLNQFVIGFKFHILWNTVQDPGGVSNIHMWNLCHNSQVHQLVMAIREDLNYFLGKTHNFILSI